jgi:hypothetical protein
LHLQIVLLLQIIGLALELLSQFCLPLIVLGFKRKRIVFLAEFLLLERDTECSNIRFEGTFLDAVFIFELFERNLNILPKFTLLVLIDQEYMFDPG